MTDERDVDEGSARQPAEREALAPGFLIAPPPLSDRNFDRSLVLLAAHESDGGSLGFILNRVAPWRLHELLEDLEIADRGVDDRDVLMGGPVSRASGFVLYEHSAGSPAGDGLEITATLSVTPSRDVLELAARGRLPGRFDLLLGYAGWAPHQLEGELRRGAWLHLPFDPELVFDVPVAERWDEVWARQGLDPAGFIAVRGGAQA
ncbi:MAG: YqgE/AlgH family protein [Deltaproteobacteria bacterium]|nr:YqgE/AlgH family protein [Deltaproteobacteria bacterium]